MTWSGNGEHGAVSVACFMGACLWKTLAAAVNDCLSCHI